MTGVDGTIRWLHLSDFHVGKDEYEQRRMFERIIRHVAERKSSGFAPDLVFVTGDIADKGLREQYDEFWEGLALPLIDTIGESIEKRFFVVPGNHDVDRRENPAFSQDEIAASESRYFDPTPEGRALRRMLAVRFAAFVQRDYTDGGVRFESDDGAYATKVVVRGVSVGVVGINTAWLSKDDKDEKRLTPGKPLLEKALTAVSDSDFRVVLGHHPLEWLIPAQRRPIEALLAQSAALYLHGHLHDAWAEPHYGGDGQFLTIQSGACFQAREGERWRNGLLWGELDLSSSEVRLQPRQWTAVHQAWTLAADAFSEHVRRDDWWVFSQPNTAQSAAHAAKPPRHTQAPKGWSVSTPSELRDYEAPLDEEVALRFFNGAVPGWQMALSSTTPRRSIVAALTDRFRDASTSGRPTVTLLLGAGCEGKTTALLQAAFEVSTSSSDWRILRRTDDAAPFDEDAIVSVSSSDDAAWLVVLDESDRIAQPLFDFLKRVPPELQGRVHFLLACRDSDWRASQAASLAWATVSNFHQHRLDGLEDDDARAIVAAWGAFGAKGLGELAKVPSERRSKVLAEHARKEATAAAGVFFGALLTVRHGEDLSGHARLMIERMGTRSIPSGGSLADALALIAAMHAEGLEYLSRPVLAQSLGCPVERLHRDVLSPLGREAAATSTSTYILTRHRRVAKALAAVLESDFSIDLASRYVDLAQSAVDAYRAGSNYVPDLAKWRYELAGHFFSTARVDLALRIARRVLDREPTDERSLVNLASLLRRADDTTKASELFRSFPVDTKRDRSFFREWATVETERGEHLTCVVLAAGALSDDKRLPRLDVDDAKRSLGVLGSAFSKLFEAHSDASFRDLRRAVGTVALEFDLDADSTSIFKSYVDGHKAGANSSTTPSEALSELAEHLRTMTASYGEALSNLQLPTEPPTFEGLRRLVSSSPRTSRRGAR